MAFLYLRNTNTIVLDELTNEEATPPLLLDGSYTVELTIRFDGTEVAGETWPVTMTYTGTLGKFIARARHDLPLTDQAYYDITVVAHDALGNIYGEWNGRVPAIVRGNQ